MNSLRKSPYVRRLYGASVLYTASLALEDLAIDVLEFSERNWPDSA